MTAKAIIRHIQAAASAAPDSALALRMALSVALTHAQSLVTCPYCGHEAERSTMTGVRDLPGCEGLEEADAMCAECVASVNAADALDAAKARPALRVVREIEAPFVTGDVP